MHDSFDGYISVSTCASLYPNIQCHIEKCQLGAHHCTTAGRGYEPPILGGYMGYYLSWETRMVVLSEQGVVNKANRIVLGC